MNILALRISAIAALLGSFLLWMYGGARAGFYQDVYRVSKFDEILEIEHFDEIEAFLPGIETLFVGFVAFVTLMAVSQFVESKRSPLD